VKIGEVMNKRPAVIDNRATFAEAGRRVAETQVSDLMVVDAEGVFVGVLSEGDLIRATLPNYDELMRDGTSIGGAWKVFLEKGKEIAGRDIGSIVIKAPLTFHTSDELIKAASAMVNKQIRVLPVVDGGVLVGTISRGDLCKAVLNV
jgi:CBS domain-containing protein